MRTRLDLVLYLYHRIHRVSTWASVVALNEKSAKARSYGFRLRCRLKSKISINRTPPNQLLYGNKLTYCNLAFAIVTVLEYNCRRSGNQRRCRVGRNRRKFRARG